MRHDVPNATKRDHAQNKASASRITKTDAESERKRRIFSQGLRNSTRAAQDPFAISSTPTSTRSIAGIKKMAARGESGVNEGAETHLAPLVGYDSD